MSLSDGSSEDDFDPRTGTNSSVSSGRCSNKEARVLKRLPKRIRIEPPEPRQQPEQPPFSYSGSSYTSDRSQRLLLSKRIGTTAAAGQSDAEESTPALDSSDTTSAENEEIMLPSTPPEYNQTHLHSSQSHYRPLFAPVDHIVKQAALGTTLFAPAVLQQQQRHSQTKQQHSERQSSDDRTEHNIQPGRSTPVYLEAADEDEVAPFANLSTEAQAGSPPPSLEPDQVARSDSVDPAAACNNTKKRKVPNQLVPNDRSLASDGEQSDDGAEELSPVSVEDHYHHHQNFEPPMQADFPSPQLFPFRAKPLRKAYTAAKSRSPQQHQHILKATAAVAHYAGGPHEPDSSERAAVADDVDDDGRLHRKSKKSMKQAKTSAGIASVGTAMAPPWSEDGAAYPGAPPSHILYDLYDPSRGPLYPSDAVDQSFALVQQARQERQAAIKPTPLPPELVLDVFTFHVPLSAILNSRIEDLRNEKERQLLAKELAVERERLRAKEAELLSLKRREMAATQAQNSSASATEVRREYVTGNMQTEIDPELTGGKIIYASKWSTSGPPGEPASDKKKGKGGDKGKKTPSSSSKKKKKKRAAHANANNHHHRDNYVPSRQPRSGAVNSGAPGIGSGAGGVASSNSTSSKQSAPESPVDLPHLPSLAEMPSLGLVPDDNVFSTASFHPQLGYTHLAPFFVGPDEWLCSWCETALLFGEDDAKVQQLIKKRKSALKVRKKAQRRAAQAAAGELPAKDSKKKKGGAGKQQPAASNASQSGGRRYAAVQTVPEGEDPHAPPPPPPPADAATEAGEVSTPAQQQQHLNHAAAGGAGATGDELHFDLDESESEGEADDDDVEEEEEEVEAEAE